MASPERDFEDMLAAALDLLDRQMSEDSRPLIERPIAAARDFVRYFIAEVTMGADSAAPGEFQDYFGESWFQYVFARTVAWYDARYGQAMGRGRASVIKGAILILGMPYLLSVPATTITPGVPGETILLHFPDRVGLDEDALEWSEAGPTIAALPRSDGMKARRLANEVADTLRSIQVKVATVTGATDRVTELRDGLVPHLERAALQIVRGQAETLKHAQWDLQMACEFALKLLAQQRGGGHATSHDLYHLYDQLPSGPVPFDRKLLALIPKWEAMAEWRYGGGAPITIARTFSRYRAVLRIVQGCVEVAERDVQIAGASIELKRPPWMPSDPRMYAPRG